VLYLGSKSIFMLVQERLAEYQTSSSCQSIKKVLRTGCIPTGKYHLAVV
jgi:hypothetical protein